MIHPAILSEAKDRVPGAKQETHPPSLLPHSRARALPGEAVALTAILAVAAILRLQDLATIPSWTDETREILIALDILAGGSLPLTGVNAYIGGLWSWLLAAAFALFGPIPELPRVVTAAFGLATIPLTYLIARQFGGTGAAWIAAGLLAVSGAHVLVTSRVAWSHSTTPFLVTLTLWLLLGAAGNGGPRLVLAGLACGLALQSHITAAPLVAAVALYVLGWRRAWLRDRWLWLAVLAFLVGAADLLLGILLQGTGAMLGDASATYGDIPAGEVFGAVTGQSRSTAALGNVAGLLLTYARLVSGAVDIRPNAAAYLRDPFLLASLALFLVGLVQTTRRVSALPFLTIAGWGVLILVILKENGAIPNGRFLMPVVPLSLALVAGGLVGLARLVRPALARRLLVAGTFGALATMSFLHLRDRVEDSRTSQQSSEALDRLADTVLVGRGPSDAVYLDPLLEKLWLDGGGTWRSALRYRLTLGGAPIAELRDRVGDERFEVDTCATNRAVLHRLQVGSGDPLESLLPRTPPPPPGAAVWIIRVAEPREDLPPGDLSARNRPPLAANGRAVRTCDRGRMI